MLRALAESTGGCYASSESLMGLLVKVDFVLHRLQSVGPVVCFAPDAPEQPQVRKDGHAEPEVATPF